MSLMALHRVYLALAALKPFQFYGSGRKIVSLIQICNQTKKLESNQKA
jgi:hypothetical protein